MDLPKKEDLTPVNLDESPVSEGKSLPSKKDLTPVDLEDESDKRARLIDEHLLSRKKSSIDTSGINSSDEEREAWATLNPEEGKAVLERVEASGLGALRGYSGGVSDFAIKKALETVGAEKLADAWSKRREYSKETYPGEDIGGDIFGSVVSPANYVKGMGAAIGAGSEALGLLRSGRPAIDSGIKQALKRGASMGTSTVEELIKPGTVGAFAGNVGESGLQAGISSGLNSPENAAETTAGAVVLSTGLHGLGRIGSKISEGWDALKGSTFNKVMQKAKEEGISLNSPEYAARVADEYEFFRKGLQNRSDVTKQQMAKDLADLETQYAKELQNIETHSASIGKNEAELSTLSKNQGKDLDEVEDLIEKEKQRLTKYKASELSGELGTSVSSSIDNILENKLQPHFESAMELAEQRGKTVDLSKEVKRIIDSEIDDNVKKSIENLFSDVDVAAVTPSQLELLRKKVRKNSKGLSFSGVGTVGSLRDMISNGMGFISPELKPVLGQYREWHQLSDFATAGKLADTTEMAAPYVKAVRKSDPLEVGAPPSEFDPFLTKAKNDALARIKNLDPENYPKIKALSDEVQLLQYQNIKNPTSENLTALENKKVQLADLYQQSVAKQQDLTSQIEKQKSLLRQSKLRTQSISDQRLKMSRDLEKETPPDVEELIELASKKSSINPKEIQDVRRAEETLRSILPEDQARVEKLLKDRALLGEIAKEGSITPGAFTNPKIATANLAIKTPYKIASYIGSKLNGDLGSVVKALEVAGAPGVALASKLTEISQKHGQQKAALLFALFQDPENRKLIHDHVK